MITGLIPSYGQKLTRHPELLSSVHRATETDLELAGLGGGRIPSLSRVILTPVGGG